MTTLESRSESDIAVEEDIAAAEETASTETESKANIAAENTASPALEGEGKGEVKIQQQQQNHRQQQNRLRIPRINLLQVPIGSLQFNLQLLIGIVTYEQFFVACSF